MIEALNQYQGLLSLLFSVVVAIATVAYAILTWQLVAETKLTRRSQTEPHVAVYLDAGVDINLKDLVVKNIGQGPAYEVELRVLKDLPVEDRRLIKDMNLFKKGLKHMVPGQSYRSFLVNLIGNLDALEEHDTEIEVVYKNKSGQAYSETFILDFKAYRGILHAGTAPEKEMAKALRKLQDDVHKISIGFWKPQVVVYTETELKEKYEQRQYPHATLWTPDDG